MNGEILAVGTELLLGEIVNTNAQFLSEQLARLGISVYYQTVVGDNWDRLYQAYESAFDRSDLVITTGGLGPTADDITKEVGAEFFKKQLVLDEKTLNEMKQYFKKQGFDWTENNTKQAYKPEGSLSLKNDVGTAPGCMISENGKILIMLPGPPFEMEPMFENYVLPELKKKSSLVFCSRRIKICGIGESKAESLVKDLIDKQTNPTIAPYAKMGETALRVTASAKNEAEALEIMQPTIDEIKSRLGDNVYAVGETTLEEAVVKLLMDKRLTISLAESCTGGLLTAQLVNCPGVSDVLLEGAVTYSNEAKIKRLGVKEQTLKTYGAVSRETAKEMAEGIKQFSGSDVGVAITGITGPGGGTEEKPVGLVYIAVSINGTTNVKEMKYLGDRAKIRMRTVITALDFIRRALINC